MKLIERNYDYLQTKRSYNNRSSSRALNLFSRYNILTYNQIGNYKTLPRSLFYCMDKGSYLLRDSIYNKKSNVLDDLNSFININSEGNPEAIMVETKDRSLHSEFYQSCRMSSFDTFNILNCSTSIVNTDNSNYISIVEDVVLHINRATLDVRIVGIIVTAKSTELLINKLLNNHIKHSDITILFNNEQFDEKDEFIKVLQEGGWNTDTTDGVILTNQIDEFLTDFKSNPNLLTDEMIEDINKLITE